MAAKAEKSRAWKYAPYFYGAIVLLAVAYIFTICKASLIDKQGEAATNQLVLNLTIALPELVIWVIATRAAIRFKQYSNKIKKAPDGDGLNFIANALLWMASYIVALTMITSLVILTAHTSYLKIAVGISNYLPVAIALVAAGYFFVGARRLNRVVNFTVSPRHAKLLWTLFAVLALLFALDFYHFEPLLQPVNDIPRFVGSVQVLLFTYVVPHIIVWGFGLYACASLAHYALHVKGTIYKRLFSDFAQGTTLVFICTYLAQLLIATGVSYEELALPLILSYILLLLGVYGFILIHRGAENLQKLESL